MDPWQNQTKCNTVEFSGWKAALFRLVVHLKQARKRSWLGQSVSYGCFIDFEFRMMKAAQVYSYWFHSSPLSLHLYGFWQGSITSTSPMVFPITCNPLGRTFAWYYSGLLIFRAVVEPQNSGKSAKSREIHKNMKNTAKFGRNLVKYMSVQHIWHLFQL